MRATLNQKLKVRYKDVVESGAYALIREDLTLYQRQYREEDKEIELFNHNGTFMWLPRWYGRTLLKEAKIHDLRYSGPDLGLECTAKLGEPPFPSQQPEAVEACITGLRQNGMGGFLVAQCGTGKTVMGVAVACAMDGPTLVLVNQEKLIGQWTTAFETFARIEGRKPKVGVIRKGRCEFGVDYPFAVAMIQSLNSREYPEGLYKSWRTVMTDEVHHLGARTWLGAVSRFNPLYLVGLTATLRRRDGLQPVFNHVIGPVLFELKRDNIQADVIFFPIPFVGSTGSFYPGGTLSKARLERRLSQIEYRNITLVEQITKAHKAGRRRHFVFSALRDHLKTIYDMLPPHVRADADFFMGQRSEAANDAALEKRVILATYEKGAEGLDVDDIDLITLATPMADVEQTVGRALRFYVAKAKPLVVDYVDTIKDCIGWAYNREKQYLDLGFKLRNSVGKALERYNG
jgi:superfamily II DNA or RNA helicase